MDAQIGRIIEALKRTGQWDNTIVVFTSDHGLAIGSHGLRGKQNMYEHTIGVPLLMRGPGIPRGKRFDAQLYLRDLYPTVCQLAGVEIPVSVEGRSAVPILQGKADSIHEHVFGYFRNQQRMIRTDRWKLIHYPEAKRFQLFDLRTDPDEMRNFASDERYALVVADLRAKLSAWQRRVGDPLAREQ